MTVIVPLKLVVMKAYYYPMMGFLQMRTNLTFLCECGRAHKRSCPLNPRYLGDKVSKAAPLKSLDRLSSPDIILMGNDVEPQIPNFSLSPAPEWRVEAIKFIEEW